MRFFVVLFCLVRVSEEDVSGFVVECDVGVLGVVFFFLFNLM